MPDAHPDAELLAGLRAGSEAAYHKLYRRHAAEVYRLARRFVHSDAEADEVVQEVFIAAFRHIDRFRGSSRLGTWLYRITVNRALKRDRWWRRRREAGPEPLVPLHISDPSPDRRAGDRQALAIAQACLDRLEPRKRAVLVLHELEGKDTKEIAEILDCPRSTVLTRLARARADLIRLARDAGVVIDETAPGEADPDAEPTPHTGSDR